MLHHQFVDAGMLFSYNDLKTLVFAACIEKYQLADRPVDSIENPFAESTPTSP
jgi:hypothetical protein